MKIGIVTGEYPPMEGGVGAFTREVALELAALDHDISILTRPAGTGISGDPLEICFSSQWGWSLRSNIARWAHERDLEVINIQFQTAAFDMHPAIHFVPSYVRDIPTVTTFHDLRVPYLFPKAGPLRNWIVKRLASTSAGVIATDREDLARLQSWGRNDAIWIPIGSNVTASQPDGFTASQFRQQLGLRDDDLLVSYFGFLNESKGGMVLIEALKVLIDSGINTHLVMIGGRAGASDSTNLAYGQQIDGRIEELDLVDRVHWTGFVPDPEVSAWFYASNVTALPYLDGVSLRRGTLMAALAHGRAIVTTTGSTTPDELRDTVKLVEAESGPALADGIRDVWLNKTERQRLEKAALETAKLFEWDSIAAETARYFEMVIHA